VLIIGQRLLTCQEESSLFAKLLYEEKAALAAA
jgi:hypothetical protein